MNEIRKICIIGAGHMGGAIAGGIAGDTGFPRQNLTVTARTQETLDRIGSLYPGISTTLNNSAAVHDADLAIIAVKPWQAEAIAEEIRQSLDSRRCTIASVVAGISFREWAGWLQNGSDTPALLRIIPNTAIALGQGTTFLASCGVRETVLKEVKEIFGRMGTVMEVDEDMMAAGTALASCGIAYALQYIDAAIRGGTGIGFTQEEARRIVISTMKGAVSLLEKNGTMPRQEIDKVTTPGGYTFRGLSAMEEYGFSEAVLQGLRHSL